MIDDDKIFKFKLFYAKFLKVDRYICQKRLAMSAEEAVASPKWLDLVDTFWNKSVAPLERAWQKLTQEEKNRFSKLMGW